MLDQRRPKKRLNLRKTLFVLPSLITLSSVFCGFDAIRVASGATQAEDFYRAAILIVFAMFFDMLDGRVARMTRTQSAFGLQLDSLADVVSFGVAPAVLMYNWSLKQMPTLGLAISFLFVAAGVVGSTVAVGLQMGGAFVLFWMAIVYISMGLIESVVGLPRRLREGSKSIPPS
jgi:CDP-diacylglycerol--serine O-phosphatidyltransferase